MASETPREIVKRCMPNAKYEHVDGIMYQKFTSPCMPSETLKKMSQLVLRPDDVFCNGWPRSGNHWTYYVVDMILKQVATPTSKSFVDVFPDFFSDEQLKDFNTAPSPRLLFSNLWIRKFPDVIRKNTRIIYSIRQPKEAIVSFYKIMSDFTNEHQFNGTWDEYFEAMLGGEMVFGPWFDHVLEFEKFMAENPKVPVYIHQFEEMQQTPVECVKKLCAFLGQSDALAEAIVANSGIESIETAVKNQSETNVKWFDEKTPKFIRKDETGSWKDYFTVSQNERFNEMFEKKMKGSKLAELVRQYI